MMVFDEQSLSVLILTHKRFVEFSLLCLAAEGSQWVAFVGVWHLASIKPGRKFIVFKTARKRMP